MSAMPPLAAAAIISLLLIAYFLHISLFLFRLLEQILSR